ncbi:putative membrane protein [Fulvivirga imtechensis AK7]|uniref:Putative membrane protein n=1 Tax=Fulvivirga imtechensis AK7 TaxID=1237149 RepID=L8JUF6_9BACT|nr:DUF502 domain-containing protein [Fulvivirga imtechensis]ELR71873.1 putative membrane protein [Fulvivirga imtechensis AK7]
MSRFTFNRILTYFFRGLLFVVPLALTIYIIYQTLEWLDGLIPVKFPGLGLIIIVINITFLGYLASFFITRPFFDQLEKYLIKIPLVNIIYTSIKDLISAFVGEQKKFNVPVTVALNQEQTVLKVGFITRDDLAEINLPGYMSVYLPHSYNFSGNHFLVDKSLVRPLHMNSTSAMKFVVSGGVSGLEEEKHKK